MKKILVFLSTFFISLNIIAQAPQKMSYQAVIRNSNSNLLLNTALGMRISILQASMNGTVIFVETQNPTTNSNGLVTIEIGTGNAVTGTFSSINWANGPYFVKTETDPTGGTNYSIIGTSQLLSVPYALHAANVINYTGGSGISVSGSTISNTSPNQTVSISGTGISSVTGSYPTFTVNTPNNIAGAGISVNGSTITNTSPNQTVSISGTGLSSVSGSYPTFTVNTPNNIAGAGISVNGNTITNTAPNQSITIYSAGISTVSGSYPNFTVNTANHVAGSGISVNGSTITNTAPNQTVSISGTGNSNITGSYPNFTVNTPTYSPGSGIAINGNTITNSAPNQTVSLVGSGGAVVTGSYPTYSVTAPRIVRGTSSGGFSPTIINGSGFTAVHTSTGIYTITFTTPFINTPTAIASLYNSGFAAVQIEVSSVSTTNLVIKTYNLTSGPGVNVTSNIPFSFIVIEN